MEQRNICYVLMVLVFMFDYVCTEELNGTSSNTTTESSSRMPRKNHVYYSPPDDYSPIAEHQPTPEASLKSEKSSIFQVESHVVPEETKPLFSPAFNYRKYIGFPSRKSHYISPDRRMSKSGSHLNWNIWNGDSSDSSEFQPPASDMSDVPLAKFENYHYPRGAWKDTPWNNARMAAMMMMMNELQEPKLKDREESKPSGFISKLTKDPSTFLLVAAIPVSILLSAVLPALMDNLNNYPTVHTIATSSKGRMLLDSFFTPVIDGVSTFGYRALEDPGCTQKIFCQVTKGSFENNTNPSILQRALYKASRFVDENYLDSYGVKALVNSLSDGNCENVPCTNFNLTDYVLKLFSKEKQN
ncbi:hypothetical protein AVEN_261434-1 [Araneus ventricosus]|uniref:Uncharacterized protein n=1 Tax=Araneus ventricosus TaxID=182803 RepID=A0A4Y2VJG1_ARAVE|nr:hypothetical protein AVEN_205563-1 [Araneus ventricosus]GBO23917.1 hypothetical protein AVEN_261434-1 [Araneus ventricosus]